MPEILALTVSHPIKQLMDCKQLLGRKKAGSQRLSFSSDPDLGGFAARNIGGWFNRDLLNTDCIRLLSRKLDHRASLHLIQTSPTPQLGHTSVVAEDSIGIPHLRIGEVALVVNNFSLGGYTGLETQPGQAQRFCG